MFMAEDKRKHESVCNGQLFKRNVIRIHSYSSCKQAKNRRIHGSTNRSCEHSQYSIIKMSKDDI